ncbi:hypothetical protein SERLA73DRAFT_140501, partial [Serpula lacrymans var. lacrymans S7.3]
MVWPQYCASNANFTCPSPFMTGGSWKKSPVTITCVPPKGSTDFFIMHPIFASLSKRSPSTMETSSMMSTLVR